MQARVDIAAHGGQRKTAGRPAGSSPRRSPRQNGMQAASALDAANAKLTNAQAAIDAAGRADGRGMGRPEAGGGRPLLAARTEAEARVQTAQAELDTAQQALDLAAGQAETARAQADAAQALLDKANKALTEASRP